MRKLIINADDLGITPQRSHGIFLCFENGGISSASLIVNGGDSDKAARHAREKGLPTGLHLNLTEGSALSKAGDIGSLLTTDGFFLGRESLRRMLDEGDIEQTHIERELRAQFEWFLDHHGQPTHVDSHHHVHIHPIVAAVLVPLFDRYGISFVRIPSEPVPPFGFEIDEERTKKIQAINAQAEAAKKLFAAHGMKFADHFRGSALSGKASQRNLRHILSRLPEGVTELMVHPGAPSPAGDKFETDPQRLTEYNMLTNPDLKKELAERKITLCSYGDLY